MTDSRQDAGLYIALISVHGLIRGQSPELGRDADTGGQIKYVLELARAVGENPKVARVDLLTRQVLDGRIDPAYANPLEQIGPRAWIVRLPCGPRRYLRKETLWSHLDHFADNALRHFRHIGRVPKVIHSHYADAGLVGTRLARMLGVFHVHTGHSLGREKQRQLMGKGVSVEVLERRYNFCRRIEAEEITLGNAGLVVTSTLQEVREQYAAYENHHPSRMVVIPPGVDLSRFHPPPRGGVFSPPVRASLLRFLTHPDKPMILALSRPDERKNIATLVRAFGENPALRERANLVLIIGQREDILSMEKGPREVLTGLLLLLDRYDLYGQVAYPKGHQPEEVPDFFRLAAKSGGVFVNPALTEPFGLTLIEAAASGLPVVATQDGGPSEILDHCRNGVLVDPLDGRAMGQALLEILSERNLWRRFAANGERGALRHYSWIGHVEKYLREVEKRLRAAGSRNPTHHTRQPNRLPTADRMFVSDIDNTLIGNREGLCTLLNRLADAGDKVVFGVATGRNLKSTLKVLDDWDIPLPDFLITSVGSVIHYRQGITEDEGWRKHIEFRWHPEQIREVMATLPGLRLQPREEQLRHKISYFVDPDKAPSVQEIVGRLRKQDLHVRPIYSHGTFLDLLPVRASKGLALSYLAIKWGIPLEKALVAGDSGNDEEMLCGNTLGVVVANHSPELNHLREDEGIYFAKDTFAWGILDGMEHYHFLGRLKTSETFHASDEQGLAKGVEEP